MCAPGIGLLGYSTCLTGFFAALLFTLLVNKLGSRLQCMISGFSAGALIAFVCFGLLPGAFAEDGLFVSIAGIIVGAITAILIESRINQINAKGKAALSKSLNSMNSIDYLNVSTGSLVAMGVVLHNIPEGIALGLQIKSNMSVGLSMCVIIALHCIPEAATFLIPLKKSGVKVKKLIVLCLILALPMGISSMLGASLSQLSPMILSLCISFSGGVIIYITCGRIIPDASGEWNGQLATLGAVLGFAAGVALTVA